MVLLVCMRSIITININIITGARIFFFKINLELRYHHRKQTPTTPFGDRVLTPHGYGGEDLIEQQQNRKFAWFTRSELAQNLNTRYWNNSLANIIYPDELVNLEQKLVQQQPIDEKEKKKNSKFLRKFIRLQKMEAKMCSITSTTARTN